MRMGVAPIKEPLYADDGITMNRPWVHFFQSLSTNVRRTGDSTIEETMAMAHQTPQNDSVRRRIRDLEIIQALEGD